jgi:hypothetical protein
MTSEHTLRSRSMSSVHFLLAHQPSRLKQPGHIVERKREHKYSFHSSVSKGVLTQATLALLAGLIKPPTVRQFIHENLLYTEEHGRSLTQFEVRMLRPCNCKRAN